GTQWHLGLDGDGGPVVVNPFNPQQAWGSDDGDYVETTNAGVSWAFPAPPTTGLPGTPTASHSSRAQPLAADANLNGLLYASGQASGTRLDLFQAAHFTTPTPAPITLTPTPITSTPTATAATSFVKMHTFPSQCTNGAILALAVAPSDSNTVWVSLND